MKLNKKQRQTLTILFSITAILGLVVFFVYNNKNKKTDTPTTPTRRVEQINKLAVKDRPYVTLTPRTDGREITLTIDNLTNVTNAEYELEYQAGSMLQGVFGTIDFSTEEQPVSKKLLFGSCSKGKCKYDDNVTGGSLTMRFEGKEEPYVLKSDFNLQQMADREGVFTSKDIKATLDVGKVGLASSTYVVIASTMGLPAELEGEVIAGPYAFLAASSPRLTQAELTIKSKDDLTTAKLFHWTGQAWTELKSELGTNKITAPVSGLGTFVLVK